MAPSLWVPPFFPSLIQFKVAGSRELNLRECGLTREIKTPVTCPRLRVGGFRVVSAAIGH